MTSASSSYSSHSDTSVTPVSKGAVMIPLRKQPPSSDPRLYQYYASLHQYVAPVLPKTPVDKAIIVVKLEGQITSIKGFTISKPLSPPSPLSTESEISIYREPTPVSE